MNETYYGPQPNKSGNSNNANQNKIQGKYNEIINNIDKLNNKSDIKEKLKELVRERKLDTLSVKSLPALFAYDNQDNLDFLVLLAILSTNAEHTPPERIVGLFSKIFNKDFAESSRNILEANKEKNRE